MAETIANTTTHGVGPAGDARVPEEEMHDSMTPTGPLGGPAGAEPAAAAAAAVKPSTPSSSAAPAAPARPAITLPPVVVELQGSLRRGLASSRFPWVRSDVANVVSWVNPLQTAAVLAGIVSLYLANSALAYSLPAIASGLLVLALVGSGGVVAYSGYTGRRLPAVALPLDAAMAQHAVRTAVDGVVGGVAALNRALAWSNAAYSFRFLAYAWLAYTYAFLATPGWLFTAILLAFIALPAYLLQVAVVDSAYTSVVLPNLQRARITVEGALEQVAGVVEANGTQLVAVVAGGVIVAAALSGYFLPLDICATLAAAGLAARDALLAVTVAAEHRAS